MPTEWEVRHRAVSVDEGIQIHCRKCGSEAGVMCTYLTDYRKSYLHGSIPRPTSRIGTPTVSIHRERSEDAWKLRIRRFQTVQREASQRLVDSVRVSPDGMRAWSAVLEWERRETAALKCWLAEHGSILWNPVTQKQTDQHHP